MLGKTPLGIVTGIWAEYSRPYYSSLNDDGQQVRFGANDITLRMASALPTTSLPLNSPQGMA